jgi:RNA polymerase sigma-32 factor
MAKVEEFARDLSPRDTRILRERLLAEDPVTLADLGKEFGVSRERVRQLEARLLRDLRDYLKQSLVDFDLYAVRDE